MAGKKMRVDKGPKDSQPAVPVSLPPNKPADKPKSERRVQKIMNNVWSNDMLRDKILEHVIYSTPSTATPDDPQINYKDIKNLRLVQKNWLLSTSRILRQNRHPLYHVHNQNRFRFFIANAEEHKKLINRFVQTISRHRRLEPYLPTFRLSLICSFFVPENSKILSDILEKCGTGMISLQVVIPKSCLMSFVFPPFSLEILQQMTIEFASHSHHDPEDMPINPSYLENSSVTYFLQQLMNSSTELKTIEFKNPSRPNTDSSGIPLGFQCLSLPPTVSTLLLKGPFSSNHLDITNPRSQIAHLTRLQIRISQASPVLDESTISKCLERHGATLKILKLCGGNNFLHPRVDFTEREPSLFKIPQMKNLQELVFSSPNWMNAKTFYLTSVNFPNLTKLKMKAISVNLFDNLTSGSRRLSRIKTVKSLEIWLINKLIGFSITLNEERMERVHRTFCCVTTLEITICGVETSGLKYIFREMGNLKTLAVNVRTSIEGNDLTCATVDGLLIGEPEWIAKGLKDTPNYWEYFQGKAGYDNNPSIMNLKGLTKLMLATKGMTVHYLQGEHLRGRLLSEVAFHFALCKMPALKTLQLFGRFQPSQQMVDLWKQAKVAGGRCGTLLYGKDRKDAK